jgi:hypothetical protein
MAAPLTENCLKSPSREHGQAVLTSEAARTSLARRLHTNIQDRAAGVTINRHSTDAGAEPALSLIATGDGDRHHPGVQDLGSQACVDV